MSDQHRLLPWYFNGTLDAEEAAAFDAHLHGCDACRRELELLGSLREQIEEHGADLFGDHPDPEELLAAADPDQADRPLEAARSAEILRHVALCAACAEESEWLRGESRAVEAGGWRAGEAERPAIQPRDTRPREGSTFESPASAGGTAPPGWGAWLGWAVAAAAVIALLVLPSRISGPLPEPFTGIVSPAVIRSTERSPAGPAAITIPSGERSLHLLLEVDLGSDAFPLAFEVIGPQGEQVFTAESLEREGLVGGAAIDFVCARADCPDGAYRARVTTADPQAPEILFAFRLVTAPPER